VAVQPDWDWCHACGFDPEGLKPVGWLPAAAMVGSAGPPVSPARPPAPFAAAPRAPVPPPNSDLPYTRAGGPDPLWSPPPAAPKKQRHILRTVLVIVGLLGVLAVAAFFLVGHRVFEGIVSTKAGANAGDPVAYTSPDGAYTVNLLGPVTSRKEPVTDSNGTMVEDITGWAGTGNGQYVHYVDVPNALPPDQEQEALKSFVQTLTIGTGTSAPAPIAGHAGRRFTGKLDGVESVGIAFVDGKRLYIIVAQGPYVIKEPQLSAFLQSFHLNAPG
jgi:hypothetical protein